jgi:hypothetical protein
LDSVELRVQLLHRLPVLRGVLAGTQTPDISTDRARLLVSISNTVQLVQPPENLGVGQSNKLIVLPCFCQ